MKGGGGGEGVMAWGWLVFGVLRHTNWYGYLKMCVVCKISLKSRKRWLKRVLLVYPVGSSNKFTETLNIHPALKKNIVFLFSLPAQLLKYRVCHKSNTF